jgi:hypothetical protein
MLQLLVFAIACTASAASPDADPQLLSYLGSINDWIMTLDVGSNNLR